MKAKPLFEAVRLLQSIAAAIATTAPSGSAAGATLHQLCGLLSSGAKIAIETASIGSPLLGCFKAATTAGAGANDFARVRKLIEAQAPVYGLGTIITEAARRICLAEECRAISATVFISRDDVETVMARMNMAFDPALDYASEALDTVSYRALLALRAAIARDLSIRALPLPKIVNFTFPKRMPSLTMAQVLYGDAARNTELSDENKAVHPLFMPSNGRALSN